MFTRMNAARVHLHVLGEPAVGVLAQDAVLHAHAVLAAPAILAAAAREVRVDRDALPHRDVPHRRAHLGHVARDVAAGPEWEGQGEAGEALADEEIEVVQRRRAHAHQDVARPDGRIRDVLVSELVEPAVLLKRERLQEAPSPAFGAFTSTAMLP
jgi:hypothetical protein